MGRGFSPPAPPSFLLPINHPLGRNFFFSPTFLYFKNLRWRPHISQSNTEHLLAKNTPSLQATSPFTMLLIIVNNVIVTFIDNIFVWGRRGGLIHSTASVCVYFLLNHLHQSLNLFNVVSFPTLKI